MSAVHHRARHGAGNRGAERQVSLQARIATQYFAELGITIERVTIDNGSAFRSHAFRIACNTLGIRLKFTLAYRPQTNGKAELFIQSALRTRLPQLGAVPRCIVPQE